MVGYVKFPLLVGRDHECISNALTGTQGALTVVLQLAHHYHDVVLSVRLWDFHGNHSREYSILWYRFLVETRNSSMVILNCKIHNLLLSYANICFKKGIMQNIVL